MNNPSQSPSQRLSQSLSNTPLLYVLVTFGLLLAYLLLGNLLHLIVFPLPQPDPATFPRTDDVFESRIEGLRHRVVKVEGDWAFLESTLAPNASGPPPHIHHTFDENFRVQSGTLSLLVNGSALKLAPGETYHVPIGTAHSLFNETNLPVVVASSEAVMPISFAACLVQLYRLLDEGDSNMALQMAVIDPICDTKVVGLPDPGATPMVWFLAPMARLAGYRNYYPEYALH